MNDVIREYRDVALDVLKPQKRDLEHGLELHAASVVCDAYGFSPRAAVDGEVLKEAVEGGASDIEMEDLTEEMTMTRCVTDARERGEYQEAWEASGVTCIFQNAGQEGNEPQRLIKRLARFTFVTDMLRDFVSRAPLPEDIHAAKRAGRHCLYMVANGVPLPENWQSVEDELRYIRVFFQLGIREMHLTYNRRNVIGDGCAETSNAGLSDFGRHVVGEMNRVGVIVDCAHSGWQTSLEAARSSEKPMVASHSVCADLNAHYRGKPDEVIRAIADTNGYMGICCIPGFLGGSGDLNALLDHIDHAVALVGVDHVAIGTDVAYTSSAMAEENKKVPPRPRRRQFWPSYWRPKDPLHDAQWHMESQVKSLAWTNWPMFTVGLVQRGYSDEDIQKIIGGNVIRVARDVLAHLEGIHDF